MICSRCGKAETDWEWWFLHVGKPVERVCDCLIDLSGATIYPWGLCPGLDAQMAQVQTVLQETVSACQK